MVGSMVCSRKAEPAVREKVIRPVSSHMRVPGWNGRRGGSAGLGAVSTAVDAVITISFDRPGVRTMR